MWYTSQTPLPPLTQGVLHIPSVLLRGVGREGGSLFQLCTVLGLSLSEQCWDYPVVPIITPSVIRLRLGGFIQLDLVKSSAWVFLVGCVHVRSMVNEASNDLVTSD